MSKNLYLCVPDPFDSSTGARLERMGILRPDGEVNVEVMRAFVQIFGGLFFDDLCDFYSDQGEVSAVTAAFSELAARKDCQNIYLLISLQYTPEWRRQEELAKAERKARAKSRPAPSAPEAGPPPAQPANTAPATPGQKEAGGETAPHKERDQILRQEYDYGLLDPELDRVSSQSPDTEAPYGAFDLIETSPDEVGGP